VAEFCDGTGAECPDDALANAGTECRAADGICDAAEVCDGANPACPDDARVAAGTECRASQGLCDPAEVCDGLAVDCPGDALADAGTECRAADGICDAAEVCDGANAACPDDARVAAGTECRASQGLCDPAEVCDGLAVDCPGDALVTAGTECRAADGICDAAEVCDGANAACPDDARVAAGTECRASQGLCDPAESCDGLAVDCPGDALVAAGTECRAADGTCDAAEVCDGANAACPDDARVAAGTECRASASFCDVAEVCDGVASSCPTDVVKDANTCAVFVDPDGVDASGCGTEWGPLACASVQGGADSAVANGVSQVFVKSGTYRATVADAPVLIAPGGVSFYGGFAGTEATSQERAAPFLNETVLDGDLTGDGPSGDDSDNVVIVAGDNVAVTGFAIQHGTSQADAAAGAGLRSEQRAGLSLTDLRIRYNSLTGTGGRGAGVYVVGGDVQMDRVWFLQNVLAAAGRGAGLAAENTVVALSDVAFDWNRIAESGRGGGMYLEGGTCEIKNASFRRNQVGDETGSARGGGLDALGTELTAVNVDFFGNRVWGAQALGGGASIGPGSAPVVVAHASFAQNRTATTTSGAGLYTEKTLTVVENSVLYDNEGDDVALGGAASLTVDNSCAQLALGGIANVTATAVTQLAASPFVLAASGELFLSPASACVDTGSDALATSRFAPDDWAQLTTQRAGALDLSPVDPGRHYEPSGLWVSTLNKGDTTISWEIFGADGDDLQCEMTELGSDFRYELGTGELASGTLDHGLATSDPELTLSCEEGEAIASVADAPGECLAYYQTESACRPPTLGGGGSSGGDAFLSQACFDDCIDNAEAAREECDRCGDANNPNCAGPLPPGCTQCKTAATCANEEFVAKIIVCPRTDPSSCIEAKKQACCSF